MVFVVFVVKPKIYDNLLPIVSVIPYIATDTHFPLTREELWCYDGVRNVCYSHFYVMLLYSEMNLIAHVALKSHNF